MIVGLSLADALSELGFGRPSGRSGVSGGCIADGQKLQFRDGRALFLKSGRLPEGLFAAEAAGLEALHRAATILRIPAPIAVGSKSEPYLLLEWIDSGRRGSAFAERLGEGLAEVHRSSADRYGFESDNFIGSTPQPNDWCDSWLEFFGERRLRYQVDLALRCGRLDGGLGSAIERIIDRLPDLLPESERPSLIHGDLWGGNLMCDGEGNPALIDPAVYYGHREADLAMTRLFGGFPGRFYSSYQSAWPLDPGFDERVELYNLYHMLNHLNLFGGGYLGSVQSIVRHYSL